MSVQILKMIMGRKKISKEYDGEAIFAQLSIDWFNLLN